MEIVEAHFQLGHTSTLKKWRHSYMELKCSFKIPLIFQYLLILPVEAYFSGDIPPLKKWRHSYMEIVDVYFQLGHTCTLKKWKHSYMEIVMYL